MGHVRLAINDTSPAGNQPFHDHVRDIHAIVNGEIYNHRTLRQECTNFYQFQSESDSEVVIPLYIRYGPKFVTKIQGEFSFCLYDGGQKYFMAARDFFGVLPLFFARTDGRLLVVSEERALSPLGWRPIPDVASMYQEGWIYGTKTHYKGVSKEGTTHVLSLFVSSCSFWLFDFSLPVPGGVNTFMTRSPCPDTDLAPSDSPSPLFDLCQL